MPPIKNWNVVPGNNISAPPFGAPESSTKLKDMNDLIRQVMADTRYLAASGTVASAATTDLGAVDETFLTISGIATITSFGTVSAGIYKIVTFSGALTLTHNATSLILLGGVNRTTVAGDCGLYVSLGGGNWKEYFYSPVSTSSYQPLDAQLTTLAGITAQQATDLAGVSTYIGTLLNNADASTAQSTLGISAFVKTLIDDADAATALMTTLAPGMQGANQSLVENGYQKLPGGLILQWGSVGLNAATPSVAVVFATPFPTATRSVQLTINSTTDGGRTALALDRTTSGFTAALSAGTSASGYGVSQWFAVGH